jgi:hypothetical protein
MTGGNFSIDGSAEGGLFTTLLPAGGAVIMKSGTTLNITGNQYLGVFNVNFTQAGGTIYGTGNISVADVFTWTGGTIALTNSQAVQIFNALSTTPGGVMNISGAGNSKTITYGGVLNNGTINWTNDNSGGGVFAGENVVFNNYGGFNIQCDSSLTDVSSVIHPVFTNRASGVITKSALVGTTSIGFKTVNLGLVQANSGTIAFSQYDDGLPPLAGTIAFDHGAVTFGAPTTVQGNIQGSGQITAQDGLRLRGALEANVLPMYGEVTNDGKIHLGDAPGMITCYNNYNQTTNGMLIVPIRGTNASTMDFGQLLVTGYSEINLAGTLAVEITEGYAPSIGATFPFMSSYQRNGTFDHLILPPRICFELHVWWRHPGRHQRGSRPDYLPRARQRTISIRL